MSRGSSLFLSLVLLARESVKEKRGYTWTRVAIGRRIGG